MSSIDRQTKVFLNNGFRALGLTSVRAGYYRPGYSNTCSNTLDARIRGWAKGFGADQLRPVTGFASTPDPVTGLQLGKG